MIEPGKLADVLVVDGRPDPDPRHLAKVHLVVSDGYQVVEGEDLGSPTPADRGAFGKEQAGHALISRPSPSGKDRSMSGAGECGAGEPKRW
jgi:hypothetical protein